MNWTTVTAIILLFAVDICSDAGQPTQAMMTTPQYVPDNTHAYTSEMLPDNILAWEATQKSADATIGQTYAKFCFSFTNISPGTIAILGAHGSCSCTMVQLPPTPG